MGKKKRGKVSKRRLEMKRQKAIRRKQTLGLIESAKVHTHKHTEYHTHTRMEMWHMSPVVPAGDIWCQNSTGQTK